MTTLVQLLAANAAFPLTRAEVETYMAKHAEHVTLSMHPEPGPRFHGGRMLADGWSVTGWEGSL